MTFFERKFFKIHLFKKYRKNNEDEFDIYFNEMFFPIIFRKEINLYWGYDFCKSYTDFCLIFICKYI